MKDNDFGCKLLSIFETRIILLLNRARWLKKHNPKTYQSHPDFKLLQSVWRVMQESRKDPKHDRYLLGNTLGTTNRHWRRCKEGLPQRYRLFFRFSSSERICVYAWLNDENTLRNAGSKSDVYTVFKHLLNKGLVPQEFADLLANSAALNPKLDAALSLLVERHQ